MTDGGAAATTAGAALQPHTALALQTRILIAPLHLLVPQGWRARVPRQERQGSRQRQPQAAPLAPLG